ncbi:5-methyltetrahydropteroyltriglutamate--homocysteine S-methyltransferase [Ravibacter arvi]|uniref:5-methyltetrahydropteroyltriglutamate--homocysteine methyltransferase n=1 Tax=Ravibacter arvi TaxID=2051041 RepID=A0ABP8LS44_9BACT
MLTQNLGYPRVGSRRELKKAEEKFWSGAVSAQELDQTARHIRQQNWETQRKAGIDLIPSNDFSLYDQILDTCLLTGAVPERYQPLVKKDPLTLYFAMARGLQQEGIDIGAMEMTKWFDTNYHYIVPEFTKDQEFKRISDKPVKEFEEAKALGIVTKPVLTGPVTFLAVGKEKEPGFDRIDLLPKLLPIYTDLLQELADKGAEWVQLDEPVLATDLSERQRHAFSLVYSALRAAAPNLRILLATYFGDLQENLETALSLPVDAIHLDLVRSPEQLETLLLNTGFVRSTRQLSLGVVDGRNIWKNDFQKSLHLIRKAEEVLGKDRLIIAPSCSLLHVPYDLDTETALPGDIRNWLAFAKQKLSETKILAQIFLDKRPWSECPVYLENQNAVQQRQQSNKIHKAAVKSRVAGIRPKDSERGTTFSERQSFQHKQLGLPLFPTTTIGSFPQTEEMRRLRAAYKKGAVTLEAYEAAIRDEIVASIRWQEEVGMDVLVHGEFERNDMVEYFGEQLSGFAFTQNGWVQSYGSRCVKPPVIYGDVDRPTAMTVRWSSFAQEQTALPVKGMLTGPVTILQWSFVRDDQPRRDTAFQIALAIRDEVIDLEKAGIKVIQIDEPAIREGLPLRKSGHKAYLDWAVEAFRLSASGVKNATQIHTHMCYSEFNDIIGSIAAMDADVITIETSRSQMELLDAFADFEYPNEIGPGVYDIHSPRIPAAGEMVGLLKKALKSIPPKNLWVNPDCGLKTRKWPETKAALVTMIDAARTLREEISR